ncbi:MAG: hypothetical protein V4580_14195 [Bacteroidota bacterium]
MSKLNPSEKVTRGQNIINSLTAETGYFPTASLPFPIADLQSCVDDLHQAVLAAINALPGTVSHMHEKERELLSLFNFMRSYVEMMANKTTDAQTVIQASGMSLAKSGGFAGVSALTVVALGNGVLLVQVPRAAGESAFVYQYSQDGNDWTSFEFSKLASAQLTNQTPASTLYIRYAPIGTSLGAYSQVKKAIVL